MTACRGEILNTGSTTCLVWHAYDLDDDCTVNLKDFALLASEWLNTVDLNDVDSLASGWLNDVPVVGATLPYQEHEADTAVTNGIIIGSGRTYLTQAAEASGRRAVKLNSTGHYVEFTLTAAANSVVVRFCIPDSSDGAGETKTLSLYVNGIHAQNLTFTSKYSWVYGAYPYTNTPPDGNAHHFYDEVRTLIGETLPAGTTVRLQKDATDTSPYYLIDLVDFEEVPAAYNMPGDFLCITSYGATPNDSTDDTGAFTSAVSAAQSQDKGLWIPQGRFLITGRVNLDGIILRGAGPWYSVLEGLGCNLYGGGGTMLLADFAIDGLSTRRTVGERTGIEAHFGSGSIISNIWVEHTEAGMWIAGPTDGLLITGCRMRNTFADGINLAFGVTNTTVEHCSIRNTGDDCMAMWSYTQWGDGPDQNNIFRNNTIQLPLLANGIGIYGGSNNSLVKNWIRDTVVNGAGIQIANRFSVFPLSGTTLVQDNRLDRTGSRSIDYGVDVGALWLFAYDGDMSGQIHVISNHFNDSTYQGILISGSNPVRRITGTTFDTVTVDTAGTYGIQVSAKGSGFFEYVTVSSASSGGLLLTSDYQITEGPGNTGW